MGFSVFVLFVLRFHSIFGEIGKFEKFEKFEKFGNSRYEAIHMLMSIIPVVYLIFSQVLSSEAWH